MNELGGSRPKYQYPEGTTQSGEQTDGTGQTDRLMTPDSAPTRTDDHHPSPNLFARVQICRSAKLRRICTAQGDVASNTTTITTTGTMPLAELQCIFVPGQKIESKPHFIHLLSVLACFVSRGFSWSFVLLSLLLAFFISLPWDHKRVHVPV
jgi:hypothetical protein